jgi:Flp pilus assembly protein TadG
MKQGIVARVFAGSRGKNEKGAAALEFALVAPLLLMVLLGIVSYGYMLSFRQGMSQGAAEGARAAAVAIAGADTSAEARTALNESLSSYGVSCSTTATGVANTYQLVRGGSNVGTCKLAIAACDGDPSSECATVKLDYAYRAHSLVPLPGLGVVMPSNLSYTAVARVS